MSREKLLTNLQNSLLRKVVEALSFRSFKNRMRETLETISEETGKSRQGVGYLCVQLIFFVLSNQDKHLSNLSLSQSASHKCVDSGECLYISVTETFLPKYLCCTILGFIQ